MADFGKLGGPKTKQQIGKPIMTEGHYVFKTDISVNLLKINFISNYTINQSEKCYTPH